MKYHKNSETTIRAIKNSDDSFESYDVPHTIEEDENEVLSE
jgi:hypothetical protein